METRTGTIRRLARYFPAICLLVLLGCAKDYPQTTLLPRGDFARLVDDLFRTTVFWAVIVFVLVEGVLVYAILKFRGRPDDPEPRQTHGSTALEIGWTIVPALILAIIAVPTVKTIFKTSDYATGDVVQIEVLGHQWWWEFRYTGLGVVTANEMHVPVGKTINLRMTTADVIHSFWVPQFAGKRDVMPLRHNPLWFKAEVTGNFSGQCAEFCGIQHARMGLPGDFRDAGSVRRVGGLAAGRLAAGEQGGGGGRLDGAGGYLGTRRAAGVRFLTKAGQALFSGAGCIGCHAMVGTAMAGQTALRGPNLSHCREPGHHRGRHAGQFRREPAEVAVQSRLGQEGHPDGAPPEAHGRGDRHAGGVPPRAQVRGTDAAMATSVIDRSPATHYPEKTGIWSWITTVDHKRIGILYGATAFLFFLIGGLEALFMRIQLMKPDNTFVSADTFNALFTMHGTTMIFLGVMPLSAMFFNYFIPLQIGARDVAFPRLNAFSYWVFLLGGLFINFSWLINAAPDTGWFGYANLTERTYSPGSTPISGSSACRSWVSPRWPRRSTSS
jgi:cytochrome c oxidase subunit II